MMFLLSISIFSVYLSCIQAVSWTATNAVAISHGKCHSRGWARSAGISVASVLGAAAFGCAAASELAADDESTEYS